MTIIVRPRAIDLSSATVSTRSRGLMPASGSSRSSRLGEGASARPISRRGFSPARGPPPRGRELRHRRIAPSGEMHELERAADLLVEPRKLRDAAQHVDPELAAQL